ncbi:YMGG-like glycine zipper-containing protein [Paludibacterium sp. B53371]|uniref:YMGG-like glycine zipper-containing protein n=1 Tax=Paludibacterium sp. B53371 TaxID=2806263 RepID=UPI001C04CCED|nr:YMGG-like glycine zipper-containing protein [Paludibacterium sp. B53371]
MKTALITLALIPLALSLSACATYPEGPSVMALPGQGKTFDQFQADDLNCRQYAQYQNHGSQAQQNATDSALTSAAVGTLIGAAAGALIGGNHQGAGVGAGIGLLGGTLAGSGAGDQSGHVTQHRYDQAYTQCMYAKGEKVPIYGHFESAQHSQPPRAMTPPPPPGW